MERTSRKNSYRRNENTRREQSTYIEGNVVRKLDRVQEVPIQYPTKEVRRNTSKNKEKALYTNLRYMLFLTAALACAAMVLISYIRIQADLTVCVENIAALESELNNRKISNDEDYNRALSSVDLEEVRRIAIGELGMTYAKEGQIINVSGEGSDYVRQLEKIRE